MLLLIFLGILTYQNIGETGRMVLMYLVSLGITAVGLMLNRKLHNEFTEILSGCGFGCIFISILITHVWFHKFNFSKNLESINVILFTGIADFLMIIMLISNLNGDIGLENLPEIPMLFIVAFFLYAVYRYTNRVVYLKSAYITLALDAVFMCLIGYDRLDQSGSMFPAIIYMMLFDAALVWEAVRFYQYNLNKNIYKFMAFGYMFTEISLLTIIGSSDVENKWIILQIILVLLNIILYAVKFDSTKYGQLMKTIMKVNESILLSVSYLIIAFEDADALVHVLKWGLIALCIGLVVIRIRENIAKESLAIEQVWTGLKITLLILSAVNANTDVLDYAYAFSIICMITSLGSIVLGFKMKAKALRIYGLGTTLLLLIKMVTIDIGELNSGTRVLAFIGGGAICFVISSVYNYINKNEEMD